MKKFYKKIINFLGEILLIVAIFIAVFFLMSRILPNFRYGLFIIQSGSMEPVIKTGSVVIDKKIEEYKEKDIITFRQGKKIITHRILEIKNRNGEIFYETKGDANVGKDIGLAKKGDVLGKVLFAIPFLGYIMAFAKTKLGIFLLIIIPSIWIIAEEIIKVRKNLKAKNAEEK
jgi:signal peptidase